MGDADPTEAGLASGLVNTTQMMGGALGLAVLASLAASRTKTLLSAGHSTAAALNGGYHAAFLVAATFAALGVVLAAVLVQARAPAAAGDQAAEAEPEFASRAA